MGVTIHTCQDKWLEQPWAAYSMFSQKGSHRKALKNGRYVTKSGRFWVHLTNVLFTAQALAVIVASFGHNVNACCNVVHAFYSDRSRPTLCVSRSQHSYWELSVRSSFVFSFGDVLCCLWVLIPHFTLNLRSCIVLYGGKIKKMGHFDILCCQCQFYVAAHNSCVKAKCC